MLPALQNRGRCGGDRHGPGKQQPLRERGFRGGSVAWTSGDDQARTLNRDSLRPQLRRRCVRSRQHNDGGSNGDTAVKVFDVLVGQTNAAEGHEAADRRWLIGAVDPILGVAEIHRACAERVGFAAGHKARQVRLTLDHLLGRQPVRLLFHAADVSSITPQSSRPESPITTRLRLERKTGPPAIFFRAYAGSIWQQ